MSKTVLRTKQPILLRNSKGRQGIYCEACHYSTHAIAQSRETNDAVKYCTL